MKVSKNIRLRVYVTYLGMCAFAFMILYKAFSIQINEGQELKAFSDSLRTKIELIQPERGNIYSEDGNFLSSSIPEFDLRVDFKSIQKDTFTKYIEPLSKKLANIFGDKNYMAYKEVLSKEYKKGSRYYLLKRKASYEAYLKVKDLEPFCKGKYKGGLIVKSHTKRINPYDLLANRVVGLWRENEKNIGLEREYNMHLAGRQGKRIVKLIAGGTWMPIDDTEIEPENGRDVNSTIDVKIQDVVENALLKQVEKEESAFGTCIVMEVKTGKIKAIANLGRGKDGKYYENYNYAISRYEPGSTFKLVSLISLFKDELITIDDIVDCNNGKQTFGKYVINDSHHGLGRLSIKNAFAQSSNVAFAKLIHQNYKNKVENYYNNLHTLHLDDYTGLGIAGEIKPRYDRDSSDFKYSLLYMGMGYKILVTPLHICNVYNTIANNGTMMKPYLVNSISEYGKEVIKYEPTVLSENILDSNSIRQIKDALAEVVETGTGKALKNPYYSICGKTGTAQVADKGIKYTDRVYSGSFVGFFPKEDPQYTICVMIRTKKGSNNYYGGLIALPVFKEVANRLFAIKSHNAFEKTQTQSNNTNSVLVKNTTVDKYNVLAQSLSMPSIKNNDNSIVQFYVDSTNKVNYNKIQANNAIIPNVYGMGLRDAMYHLESRGLKVICVGSGKVTSQSIPAGNPVHKGQTITIRLN
ncbi:MAG: penicillin-binding protein [Chitinophagaceae bacterium]